MGALLCDISVLHDVILHPLLDTLMQDFKVGNIVCLGAVKLLPVELRCHMLRHVLGTKQSEADTRVSPSLGCYPLFRVIKRKCMGSGRS